RKQERAYVQGGGDVPADDSEPETGDLDQDDETQPKEAVAATKMYDAGNLTIMVTTSEISREEEDKQKAQIIPRPSEGTKKKHNIPVNKKQQKTTSRRRSAPKLQKKREKRKGNVKKTR
ncbi:Nucleolar protein, partial [Thalictrum thalictroides]